MPDKPLYIPSPPLANDWQRLYRQYEKWNQAILSEMAASRATRDDLNPELLAKHHAAAHVLIECPTTHFIQVGQKMRVVQNLANIDQIFPNLSHIIVQDIFKLLGIENADTALLPTPHAVA